MKYIVLTFMITLTIPSFSCSEKALDAVKYLDYVNSNKNKSEIIDHKYLGQIMITTGYLYKYQTKLRNNKVYQAYLKSDNCLIKEIKLVN